MNSHAFALELIKNDTVLDYDEFTERAIKAVLVNELANEKFMSALKDFNSFEGLDSKFCVNFTGAWLKYALNDKPNTDKLKAYRLLNDILGHEFEEKEMVAGTRHHLLSNKTYRKINWIEDLDIVEEDHSDQPRYILKKCLKQRSNNSTHEIGIVLLRPDDFLDIITASRCVSEYRTYFIKLAKIRRTYQKTYLPWILANKNKSIDRLEQKIDKQSDQINELLGLAKEQRVEISEARQDIQDGNIAIDQLTDTVEECREVIIERMDAHTIDPKSTTKKQYFVCLQNLKHTNELYVIRSQKSNIRKQMKTRSGWKILIDAIEDPNSIKMFNRFKDRVNQITKDAKFVWNEQLKAEQITRDEYNTNVHDLLLHPVISITRNNVEFDPDQISLKQVRRMMTDTTYERFMLAIP